jgi:hypothetical protein
MTVAAMTGLIAAACPAVAARPPYLPGSAENQMRKLPTLRGLAQGQLAEAMGVSRQTINSIEIRRRQYRLPRRHRDRLPERTCLASAQRSGGRLLHLRTDAGPRPRDN